MHEAVRANAMRAMGALEPSSRVDVLLREPGASLGEVVRAIEAIAFRRGVGDLLAEGSLRAAKGLGDAAVDLTVTVKGQELPAHMPQHKRSLGLIYAVNPFGADHQSSEHDTALRAKPGTFQHARLTELDIAASQVKLTFADIELVSKLVEGKFPDYTRVIPKGYKNDFTIGRDEFPQFASFARLGVRGLRAGIRGGTRPPMNPQTDRSALDQFELT